MRLRKEDCILYAVTDRSWLGTCTLAQQVEEALKGGVTMVQLREKELDEAAFEKEALQIQALCRRYQVPFLINDNVALAKKIHADGVHVGQNDMETAKVREILGKDKIIGVTAKTVEQARRAELAGADYLGSGAVFGTSTKTDARSMDLETFRIICESVQIPVVAIGGITSGNIEKLTGLGAAGVAVVSGIFAAKDIMSETRRLRKLAEEI